MLERGPFKKKKTPSCPQREVAALGEKGEYWNQKALPKNCTRPGSRGGKKSDRQPSGMRGAYQAKKGKPRVAYWRPSEKEVSRQEKRAAIISRSGGYEIREDRHLDGSTVEISHQLRGGRGGIMGGECL